MNKRGLVKKLHDTCDLTEEDAQKVVTLFFEAIADALAHGERVEIRGLCSWYVKNHKGYIGRNPKTGRKVKIAPKRLPFFKVGKELKERVNG